MALIKSSLLSDLSGSIGGTTYARNRGGLYARNKTVPINPRTAIQEANRNLFGAISTVYGSLTQGQLDGWRTAGHAYPQINRLGDSYFPSGRQLFMMCNQNLALVDLPSIVDAPPPDALPVLPVDAPIIVVEADASSLVTFGVTVATDANGNTALKMLLKYTPPMAIARGQSYRNLIRGPWNGGNVADNSKFATGATTSNLAKAKDKYAAGSDIPATAGQVINYAYRYIDLKYGLSTQWLYGNSVITPA